MNGDLQQPLPLLPPPPVVCDDCNSDDRLILHNVVRVPKSPPQKLCTACVLLHYHKSCCAECFEPYDANSLSPPPLNTAATTTGNNRLLPCMRCDNNWSHLGCPGKNIPRSPYICPPCRTTNYKYFDFRKPSKNNQSRENGGHKKLAIDLEASRQLEGASRIASITMTKAAAMARVEAERKAKEAALAKKRAREAIDHVMAVAAKVDSVKRREISTATGPKGGNYVPVRNGGSNAAGDVDVKNSTGRGPVNGNGAIVPVPVPVSVVMPPRQQPNNGSVGVSNGGAVKASNNAGQS